MTEPLLFELSNPGQYNDYLPALDVPEARAELDASLQEVYATMFITASPAPVKAALTLLGHRVGGLRLPLVECDEQELQVVRDALANHGLLSTSRPTTPDRTAA